MSQWADEFQRCAQLSVAEKPEKEELLKGPHRDFLLALEVRSPRVSASASSASLPRLILSRPGKLHLLGLLISPVASILVAGLIGSSNFLLVQAYAKTQETPEERELAAQVWRHAVLVFLVLMCFFFCVFFFLFLCVCVCVCVCVMFPRVPVQDLHA